MRITSEFGLKTLKATASAPLTPKQMVPIELTGAAITSAIDKALGHHAPIGGINVSTQSGWFGTRPSGTENIYKIDAESFSNVAPLLRLLLQARQRGRRTQT